MTMTSRRVFLAALPALGAAAHAHAQAPGECVVFTPKRQQQTSPDEALELLVEGNARFVADRTINCDMRAQIKQSAGGQAPFAVVVACIDSRVPPELVFDQRLGDMFCARVAGPLVNDDILGSLEFATKLMGARLVVVLGHSDCGAIKGATDGAKLGHLTAMLGKFAPAIKASSGVAGEHSSKNTAYVQVVAETNVKQAAKQLTARSDVLRGLVETRGLRVVAAMHDVATGRVTFFA